MCLFLGWTVVMEASAVFRLLDTHFCSPLFLTLLLLVRLAYA